MSDEKPKKGIKIEAEELAKLNPDSIVEAKPAPVPEVEGQYLYLTVVECPWCGALNPMQLSSHYQVSYRCPHCGNVYWA